MTNKKVQINIVYSPATGPQKIMFENERGVIWQGPQYDSGKNNVGMGWYSIRNPKPSDSILVVEPFCVLQRDYDVSFLKRFKHIFTWATKAMNHEAIKNKVVAINHPTYHNIPNLSNISKNWMPWDKREDEIVIIANNKASQHHSELYSLRVYLADLLDVYSPFKVSWYGQIPLKKKYFRGTLPNKAEVLGKAKFSICTENSFDQIYTHNYFTEKMPDVWMHGAVPIYMGCYNINDLGSLNGCYIDLRPLIEKSGKSWKVNKEALNNKIVTYTEQQYQDYIKNLNDHVVKTKLLEKHHAYSNVYEKMIDTFYERR